MPWLLQTFINTEVLIYYWSVAEPGQRERVDASLVQHLGIKTAPSNKSIASGNSRGGKQSSAPRQNVSRPAPNPPGGGAPGKWNPFIFVVAIFLLALDFNPPFPPPICMLIVSLVVVQFIIILLVAQFSYRITCRSSKTWCSARL